MSAFDSGADALDSWLMERALKAEGWTARTYVVAAGALVVGYYTLAAASEQRAKVPGRLRRNAPDPVPLIVLARLAVDQDWQGRGLGQDLLRDALARVLQASLVAGVRAVLVHAIDESARAFYRNHGFMEFPLGSRTLFLPIETVRDAL